MVTHWFSNLREKSGFDKLEKREKLMVLFGLVFVTGFLLLQFGLAPYLEANRRLDAAISKRQSDINELLVLQQEYRSLKAEAGGIKEQLAKRPANFSLFSFIDRQAAEADVKSAIGYMKPSTAEGEGELLESAVEMKLQQISLEKLVSFLQLIESPENVVAIKRISIQEGGKDQGLLDVIMQIVTFEVNS